MLKKLLRYDLKSVFKYWWIAAIASIGLSAIGGLCLSIATTGKDVPPLIAVLIVFAVIFTIFGIIAFSILSLILVYVRFYKNFFTDEGYLTFTLPVKRSQLLNSKLISSVLTMCCTSAILIADIFILLALGIGQPFFDEFLTPFVQLISELFVELPIEGHLYIFTWAVLVLISFLLSSIFSTLFLFACITFAAVITKKAKVITAIGIYYAASGVMTGFLQILYMFGFTSIIDWIAELPQNTVKFFITALLLGITLALALVCLMLYTLEYFMLDRKLNLS